MVEFARLRIGDAILSVASQVGGITEGCAEVGVEGVGETGGEGVLPVVAPARGCKVRTGVVRGGDASAQVQGDLGSQLAAIAQIIKAVEIGNFPGAGDELELPVFEGQGVLGADSGS